MQNTFTPIVFYNHGQRLRCLMADNQPWFVARDYARLIGVDDAREMLQALEPFEKRQVLLSYTDSFHEEVDAISDAGAYKALFRFGLVEHDAIGRWLAEVLVPTLHDYHRDPGTEPRRAFLHWDDHPINVVKWQREVWVAWRDLPLVMKESQEAQS